LLKVIGRAPIALKASDKRGIGRPLVPEISKAGRQGAAARAHAYAPRIGLGEVVELFGVTARALRYYEQLGLIEATRDRMNRRRYDAIARDRLLWIVALRGVGLGLAEIAEILARPERGSDLALGYLAKARKQTLARLGRIESLLTYLQAAEAGSAPAKPRG
jgi:DNA-binding transcriptional MerR regulator